MANIYDVAGNMQHAQPVTAYMQGVQYRNSLADLAAKRVEQARQDEIRNGLMQFYRQARPERTQINVQGPNLLDMAQQGANMGPMSGLGVMRDAPKYMPRADYLGQLASVLPQTQKQTIPAQPGGMDYQGAADYLASNGDFESMGALAKLRSLTQPQALEWTGVIKDAEDAQGNQIMLGMTNQGPRPIEGYRPRQEAQKAPQTRSIKVGGKEVTQEWDGSKYVTISEAPREMPKPEKPQDPRANLDYEIKLGDRYQREAQSFREVRQARDNVVNSLGQNSAAGDLAAATAIMKMLDPGSVVRESELGMAMNATGALDRIGNYAQMIQNGQRLNPMQRKEMMSLSATLYGTAEKYNSQTKQRFTAMAKQYRLDPYNITGEREAPAAPTSPAPAPTQSPAGWGIKRLP